jgi:hypothetical protein
MSTVLSKMKTSAWFWGLYTVLAVLLVCYVPTLVGGKFVASDSYVFGYNNRVGVLLVLLFTVLAARISPGPAPQMSADCASDTIRPLTFWLCASLIVAASIALAFLTSHLGSFGESTYLINRIELASRGLHPYRDFEFSYGVLFLYAPIALASMLNVSIPNSYYCFWVVVILVGTWLLAQVVNRVDLPGRHRNAIFIMLFLFSFVSVLSTGLNYTSFRFAFAPFLAISVFEVIRHPGTKHQIFGSLLAVFYTSILLLVSPEIAVAYAFGISAFMFLLYIPSTRKIWVAPYLGMLVLIVVLFVAADRLHTFDTLKSFGSGGFNFPIIPSPSILFFLFALFISARQVLAAFARPQLRSNALCVCSFHCP